MTTGTFKHVEGRNVIAADTAESIGSVKGFVMDPTGRTIESVHVDGHGRRAHVVPWAMLQAFGTDVVMARPGAEPEQVDDDHQKAAVKGVVTLLGARVLSTDGLVLGTVTDAEFDTATGMVVRIVTDTGSIESDRIRSLGSYALVVTPTQPSIPPTNRSTLPPSIRPTSLPPPTLPA